MTAAAARSALLDPSRLVRAVATGRGPSGRPRWRRVELRPVQIKAGPRLQIVSYADTAATTANYEWPHAEPIIDDLLAEGFGEWRIWAADGGWHLTATARGTWRVRSLAADPTPPDLSHDRAKSRVIDPTAPFLHALGISDDLGRIKPSRQEKYTQIEQMARLLLEAVREGIGAGRLTPPLAIADLGCGNAYLTFAAVAALESAGIEARVTGVDLRPAARERNTALAEALGWSDRLEFVEGAIADWAAPHDIDVLLALHACDTATDDVLAVGVRGQVPLILAAPCCHHDLQRQLDRSRAPLLLRHGLLRERFADLLTDALRAEALRLLGYRVDVVEFVASEHTPRNLLLRAHRTRTDSGVSATATAHLTATHVTATHVTAAQHDDLIRWHEELARWQVIPRLARDFPDPLLPPVPATANSPAQD